MIDEAASLVPGERLALCVVTQSGADALHAAAFGDPQSAWAAAADVSAAAHVRYLDAPVRRVLSLIPAKYDDMWTGAKGFYKVEPVVADGGQVVLYAPHIRAVSVMHPQIAEIGYHCRDYFVKQWDRFEHMPWGDLAHSTHLRGAGTYDAAGGERAAGHGHAGDRHPRGAGARRSTWTTSTRPRSTPQRGRRTRTRSSCPQAGEVLYRLR